MFLWGNNTTSESLFEKNTAERGGAIETLEIFHDTGSTFSNNTASIHGGAVAQYNCGNWSKPHSYFTRTQFDNNKAANGGAFYSAPTLISNGDSCPTGIEFNTVSFISNTASAKGGAIYNESDNANALNSLFERNIAAEYGGAIYNNQGTFAISGSTFSANTANLNGGAIRLANTSCSMTITNSLFKNNFSNGVVGGDGGYCGGAIYSDVHSVGYVSLTISGSTFTGNNAYNELQVMRGGALDLWGNNVSSTNTFQGNTAQKGGAIDIYQVFTDTGSTFTNNTAANGGAIALTNAGNWSNPTVSFTNSIITGNTATVTEAADGTVAEGNGAGIYSVYLLTVNGGTISSNYTRGNGGGVYQQNGTATFNGVLIDSNTSSFGTPGTDKGGGHGGGLSMNGTVIVNDTTFTNNLSDGYYGGGGMYVNTSGTGTVTNSLFRGNRAFTGAGMASIWARYTVNSSTFTGNSATNWGGGLSKWAGGSSASTASVVDSVITGNYAGAAGGGLYGKNFVITGTLVDGNTSGGTGGGYSMNTHDGWGFATISDSTFSNNRATGSGGAIYLPGSYATKIVEIDGQTQTVQNLDANNTLVVTGSLFRNNIGKTGGAIYEGNSDTTLVYASFTNSIFDANTATDSTYGGGALYLNSYGSTQTVNNSTFTNNVGAGAGGAITSLRGLTEINNTLFEANTSNGAGYSGGAISEFGMGTVSVNNSTFSHNVGVVAGAIDATSVNAPSTVIVKNSLFTGNTASIGAIKTRGAYNYLENVTFETETDNVLIEGALSITLKGNIIANSVLSMSGCDIAADGLKITFGYTGGTTSAWFGNAFVTADGATTGLESVTFANTGNVYFEGAGGQDLTGVDVTIITDAYVTPGTYLVASGISGIDTNIKIMRGDTITTTPFDTPYVFDNSTRVQKVNFGGSVLRVTTADTLTISGNGDNAFDSFTSQANLDTKYNGYTGNITGIVSDQSSYSLGNLIVNTRANIIQFDASVTNTTVSKNILDRDLKIGGNGVSATSVTAGAYYGNGNSLALKDIAWSGSIYGGGSNSSVASVELSLENVQLSKGVYGGGVATAANTTAAVTGDVVTTLKNVTGGKNYYGAGYATGGGAIDIDGAVKTTIDGGVYQDICNGPNMAGTAGGSCSIGATELTITGGTFNGLVGNGGIVRAGQTSEQGNCSLTIEGGTFNNFVYGGAYAYGSGTKSTAIEAGSATVEGNINITISGGVFTKSVFGGSLANNSHIATKNTSITGDICITLDATSAITLNEHLVAGSLGKGSVTGNTTIIVKGNGANLAFGTASYVTGTSEYGTNLNPYVSGTKTLAFDGFSGAFGAQIANGAFDTFEFSADSSVDLTYALDLSGNALNITGTFEGEVTLLTDTAGLTWGNNTVVTLFGEVATGTAGVWESDNYRLTATSSSLAVSSLS